MAIGWHEGMATGGTLLDQQHRRLLQHANTLLDAVSTNAERPQVEKALRSFGDYAVRHFSQDEDCAVRGECPAVEWNGAARAELIRIVAAFRQAYERQGASGAVADDLTRELAAWVARYIPGPEGSSRPCVVADRRA